MSWLPQSVTDAWTTARGTASSSLDWLKSKVSPAPAPATPTTTAGGRRRKTYRRKAKKSKRRCTGRNSIGSLARLFRM